MFIYSIAVLLLALQNSIGFKIRRSDVPDCTNVGYVARKTFLEEHNRRRASLAKGELEIGDTKLPAAADMHFMAYNCSLEEEAKKLTAGCRKASEIPQSDKTRANVVDIKSRIDNGEISAPKEAVSQWWDQSSQWHKHQGLTMDNSAIPFFLMAQAEGDQVGCSVRFCNKGDPSYYSVACVYGTGVEAGKKLYEQGETDSKCAEGYEKKDALCKKEKKKRAD